MLLETTAIEEAGERGWVHYRRTFAGGYVQTGIAGQYSGIARTVVLGNPLTFTRYVGGAIYVRANEIGALAADGLSASTSARIGTRWAVFRGGHVYKLQLGSCGLGYVLPNFLVATPRENTDAVFDHQIVTALTGEIQGVKGNPLRATLYYDRQTGFLAGSRFHTPVAGDAGLTLVTVYSQWGVPVTVTAPPDAVPG